MDTRPLFISHAHEDRLAAANIVSSLEATGSRCWVVPRDIPPGANYAEAIIDGIEGARAIIILLSARASNSIHVFREVERALQKGVRLGDRELPYPTDPEDKNAQRGEVTWRLKKKPYGKEAIVVQTWGKNYVTMTFEEYLMEFDLVSSRVEYGRAR